MIQGTEKMDNQDQSEGENIILLKEKLAAIEAQVNLLFSENALLRQLYERAPLSCQLLDENGYLLSVNQAWLDALGYDQAEVIGRDFSQFLLPDWRSYFRDLFADFKAAGEVFGGELAIRKKDGAPIFVSFNGKIGNDARGNAQQAHCMLWDITKQKQDEELLRSSKLLIERIINTIPLRVFWKDIDLVYRGCNTSFAQDAGFADPKDIVGKDDFMMGWRDQAELYRSDDRQVIESGCAKLFIEEPQTTTEGNLIYLLTSKVPLRNSQGEITGVLGTYMDITARKQAESENERLQIQLSQVQKMEAIGHLAAGIAHEINTPSQYLGSNIEFLSQSFEEMIILVNQVFQLEQAEQVRPNSGDGFFTRLAALKEQSDWEYLKEEIPKALAQSRQGIAKISTIVLAMKEFSHPGGKEKQQTDVNRLIETIVTISTSEWKYIAEIERHLDGQLSQIPCLPNEMGQVFLIILVNAAQAIAEKLGYHSESKKGRIIIASRSLGDEVEIAFSDSGNGIPQKIQDKIYHPFFTTKEVGKGSGQGLAIAYDIVVNKHGGRIACTSKEGEGTTFRIFLPRG